ncbi:MAG: Poly(glycerophosphate) glycerophosphotransferase family protein [Herbinix sp.]|jgi:CDP-glycerol glycerophosphotransferase (TagB/SpsB family)|nr:Poly(glycerophosphate) glycerophosphotransferase family protein [Herbinix sp.]
MSRVWREIKYWSQLFLLPIYGLSFLSFRDKNIWVFGSTFGRRFADNPKYFYLYMRENHPKEVKVIWITKQKDIMEFMISNNLKCYYLYSLKGIWYSLRAKVYIYDNYSKDICYTLSGGAIKLNLWHGIPLKKIQKDNVFDRFRNPRSFWAKIYSIPRRISDEKPSDYVLTTSKNLIAIFSSAFQTKNVLVSGYPRNDILLTETIYSVNLHKEEDVLDKLKTYRGRNKIILYMPTFRDSEMDFFHLPDLDEFCKYLEQEKIYFCVKLHPKSKLHKKFSQLATDQIIIASPDADPYPLLTLADVLVTDYSSIYFDYLLTGKPIIFFDYDYEEYLKESRELYFNYELFTPGKKVKNFNELIKALHEKDVYKEQREQLKLNVFDNSDRLGSQTLYQEIRHLTR